MAKVDIRQGYKSQSWFDANPNHVLLEGQVVHLEQSGTYKLGDGTNKLSDLDFLGGSGGGDVTSVNGQSGVVVLTTDDIVEGSTNFYFSTQNLIDGLGSLSTDYLPEGSNLYYTNARVLAATNIGQGIIAVGDEDGNISGSSALTYNLEDNNVLLLRTTGAQFGYGFTQALIQTNSSEVGIMFENTGDGGDAYSVVSTNDASGISGHKFAVLNVTDGYEVFSYQSSSGLYNMGNIWLHEDGTIAVNTNELGSEFLRFDSLNLYQDIMIITKNDDHVFTMDYDDDDWLVNFNTDVRNRTIVFQNKSDASVNIGYSYNPEKLNVSGNVQIGYRNGEASDTPNFISLGGTYGNSTAGSANNLKLWMFDVESGDRAANAYGLGMSTALLEIRSGAGADVGIFTNDANHEFRFTSSGNLGIGTASPTGKLHIVGNSSYLASNFENTNAGGSVAFNMVNDDGNNVKFWKFGTSSSGYKIAGANSGMLYNYGGNLTLLTDSASSSIFMSAGARSTVDFAILGNGAGSPKFGFNTSTPTRDFDLVGNVNGGIIMRIENASTGSAAYAALEVINGSGRNGYFYKTSDNYSGYGTIIDSGDMVMQNNDIGNLVFWNSKNTGEIKMAAGASSTYQFRIKANGGVTMANLPTSSAGLSSGDLWNDSGTVKIV